MGKRAVNSKNKFLVLPPLELRGGERITATSRMSTRSFIKSKEKDLVGTPEEIEEAYELAMEYTYKILEYGDKNELTQEQADFLRRYFYFLGKGPRRNYYQMYGVTKLTQADVFFLLSSDESANELAPRFGIQPDLIRSLRRGDEPTWYPEFCLVKRLKRVIYNNLKKIQDHTNKLRIPCLFERQSDGNERMLFLFTSLKKAKEFRKDYLGYAKWYNLTRNNTLEIKYPVKYADVYK